MMRHSRTIRHSLPDIRDYLTWRSFLIVMGGVVGLMLLALALLPVAVQELNFPIDDGLSQFSIAYRGLPPPSAEIIASDGTRGNLSAFRGKVTLVNIWATWCPPCIVELPSLVRLQQQYAGTDFQVVTIPVDINGWDAVRAFAKRHPINLPVYVDASGPAISEFEYFSLPTSILLDRDGKELGRLVGSALWDSERGAYIIRQALDGSL